ncbi:hypothetical protein ACE1BH_21525, partial [Aeromonas jandaei]
EVASKIFHYANRSSGHTVAPPWTKSGSTKNKNHKKQRLTDTKKEAAASFFIAAKPRRNALKAFGGSDQVSISNSKQRGFDAVRSRGETGRKKWECGDCSKLGRGRCSTISGHKRDG